MMKIKYFFILPLLLTGCDLVDDFLRPATPQCEDKDIIKLVNNILTENFEIIGISKFIKFSVEPEYELSYSRDTRTRTCSAYVSYNIQSNLNSDQKDLVETVLMFGKIAEMVSGTNITKIPIKYTINVYKKQNDYVSFVRIVD